MKRIAVILLVLASLPAQGTDFCNAFRLQLNGLSKHTNTNILARDQDGKEYPLRVKYNEVNPGIGIVCDTSENVSVSLGQYKNSYYNDSIYVAAEYHTRVFGSTSSWGVEVGMGGALASGYGSRVTDEMVTSLPSRMHVVQKEYDDIAPLLLAVVNFTYKDIAKLKIGYAPYSVFGSGGTDLITVNAEVAPWRF